MTQSCSLMTLTSRLPLEQTAELRLIVKLIQSPTNLITALQKVPAATIEEAWTIPPKLTQRRLAATRLACRPFWGSPRRQQQRRPCQCRSEMPPLPRKKHDVPKWPAWTMFEAYRDPYGFLHLNGLDILKLISNTFGCHSAPYTNPGVANSLVLVSSFLCTAPLNTVTVLLITAHVTAAMLLLRITLCYCYVPRFLRSPNPNPM